MAVLSMRARLPVTRGLVAVLALAYLASAARPLVAQELDVPVRTQVPILLKVISFDRQLRARAPREVVVGVVMQGGYRGSVLAHGEAVAILATPGATVDGIPVRVVTFDLDRLSIEGMFANTSLTHLYVTPLRAVDIGELAVRARAARVTTLASVPEYLTRGLSLGVGLRAGRPRILVNVRASRAEGAELSAELLKLADLIP
jgi:hypothetical protein